MKAIVSQNVISAMVILHKYFFTKTEYANNKKAARCPRPHKNANTQQLLRSKRERSVFQNESKQKTIYSNSIEFKCKKCH